MQKYKKNSGIKCLGVKNLQKRGPKMGGGEPNGEGACGEQGVSLRETGGFITSFWRIGGSEDGFSDPSRN